MRQLVLLFAAMALALLLASRVAWAVNELGTNGRDTLRGTNGNDNLSGRGGNDRLFGKGGRDNLLGGPGKDIVLGGDEAAAAGGDKNLAGGPGNDVVLGGFGSDLVAGNEGNDLVQDGPLREFSIDSLSAGEGNDVVGIFNDPAFEDRVTCGGGFDRVFADRKDVAAPDCERVADRPSEFEALFESIPQSFFEGLPPPFNQQ